MLPVKPVQAGMLFAVAAYSMWGVAPIYFKWLAALPAPEILMHRIVWSAVVLLLLVVLLKQIGKVRQALKTPRVLLLLLCSGGLLAGNWLLFIWAINQDRLLDASLGYYINPLLNVALGRLFLAERLRPLQKLAVGLAASGVIISVVSFGALPWIALTLAASFGTYGLIRKQVAVDSLPGLAVETWMMLPFALAYWLVYGGTSADLSSNDFDLNLLLLSAGIVTTAPLLCFTAAARRIRYSTLGFFQYIGPSIMFLLAVWLFAEPFESNRMITFAFVWSALLLFTYDSLRDFQRNKQTK